VLALFERSNNIALSGSVVVVVVIGPSGLVWFCWERERGFETFWKGIVIRSGCLTTLIARHDEVSNFCVCAKAGHISAPYTGGS